MFSQCSCYPALQQAEVTIVSERWLCNFTACNHDSIVLFRDLWRSSHLSSCSKKVQKDQVVCDNFQLSLDISPTTALPNIFQHLTIIMVTKFSLNPNHISLIAISLYCLSARSCAPPSIPHNFSRSLHCCDLEILEKIFAVTEREKISGPRPG